MSVLFNEHEADQHVKQILLRQQIRRSKTMSEFIKADDGTILKVTSVEDVSREQLEDQVRYYEKELANAQNDLTEFDALNSQPAEQPQPEAPAPAPEAAPVEQPAEAQAPVAETPETPTVPAPQPEQPTEPQQVPVQLQ